MAESNLVRYSRAGDVFHYRWAARRCLKLINPKSSLESIIIEGSKERQRAGEYVIDVAEYIAPIDDNSGGVSYYQLKHSETRKDQQFQLSDLKDTIEGFANRYSDHNKDDRVENGPIEISFSIVTNRPIAEKFKQNIIDLSHGKSVSERFHKTIKKYTKLDSQDLRGFCASLKFIDGEGDYVAQRHQLHAEMAQILAGTVNSPLIDSIVALVHEKALPDTDGYIVREDILKRFGVTSERDLFPAPPEFETIENVIKRDQHQALLDQIRNSPTPLIVKATAGIGKSVFARQIVDSLPFGSQGIVYDCFGGGRYRNRSEFRHRHRDALVQIVNELASQGLCDRLIVQSTALADEITRKFLSRIQIAIDSLRKMDEDSVLVIAIDAADNAEMAALEFGDSCFVHELLREQLPDGCRLVMLARNERVHLLKSAGITELELKPFSINETLLHLRNRFPQATEYDGIEFHRLTSGNPRIQANALSIASQDIKQVLATFGPDGTSVQEQIEMQLDFAISVVKDKLSTDYQQNIDAICLGLATLPPLIPLRVLAAVADVDEDAVTSFIADLGRPLWLSDTFVQFRDEPTETWFKGRFSSSKDQIAAYIERLKPFASIYSYVAETLPALLLQAEDYDELINLALSDDFLPQDNPINQRNIRIYRLQFAFRAALKQKRYADAARLALRAGEESASDTRQLALLKKNIDLIAPLQNEQRVQELAFRRTFRGKWDGSENIYTASLLSSVKDFQGEARSYLRAGEKWLNLYFEERKKRKDKFPEKDLRDEDIVELEYCHLNLFGVLGFLDSIHRWRSPDMVYRIGKFIIKRLIDLGDFETIQEILQVETRDQYQMLALAEELIKVGRFPESKAVNVCLDLLATRRAHIKMPKYSYGETMPSALISFLEWCAARQLPSQKILRVLRHYFPVRATSMVLSNHLTEERDTYLQALALRYALSNNPTSKIDDIISEILPKKIENDKTYQQSQDIKEFKEIVGGLLPWYIARGLVIVGKTENFLDLMKDAEQRSKSARSNRYRSYDTIPFEISRIIINIMILSKAENVSDIEKLYEDYLKECQQIRINDRLDAVYGAYRTEHLSGIKSQLEKSAYDIVVNSNTDEPETKAEWFTELARAVFSQSLDDAAAYFDCAIEAVSKFGDELHDRWEAVLALARQISKNRTISPEMAYRFMRCAELVNDYKKLDLGEVVRICTRLSPVSALSTISRWHDREVGYFYDQIPDMADELVRSEKISPATGWSLSVFFKGYGLADFASLCIEKESSPTRRAYILKSAVHDLKVNEFGLESWQRLSLAIKSLGMGNGDVDDLIDHYVSKNKDEGRKTYSKNVIPQDKDGSEKIDWENILGDLNLSTSSGIDQALSRYNVSTIKNYDYKIFWQEIFNRIDERDAKKSLTALGESEEADRYDILRALDCYPNKWREKISVKKYWRTFVILLAHRYASDLTNPYTFTNFCEHVKIEDEMIPLVRESILEGLSDTNGINDSGMYFNFVNTVCPFLSHQESLDLFDYALSRFEVHIEDEFADGPWDNWLTPPDDLTDAVIGFLWSCLGSPSADLRWRAAHCVRKLADFGCENEINLLLMWPERDSIGPFGCHQFPFYKLHACLYLLIALARVSLNNPGILKCHHSIFSTFALGQFPHILIQKYAADIALNIEKVFPGTYHHDIVEKLQSVGISKLPVQEINGHEPKYNPCLKKEEKADSERKFYYGWDFDRYWFEPLGNVFSISREKVMELATDVIFDEWGIETDGGFENDPRKALWHSSRDQKAVWHDHGSYPQVDTYSFYLSYHAMFVVAAKLLKEYPVVHHRNWIEDEWEDWLQRHSLTRHDGLWLADCRDPAPLRKPDWIGQYPSREWLSEIDPRDFLKGIVVEHNDEVWLNIAGSWEEKDERFLERYYIMSALVSPTTSNSLLHALSTCPDPTDYKLPDYLESNMEINLPPFILQGWIWHEDVVPGLDELDPLAGRIEFTPFHIGQSIMEKFDLKSDSEERKWFLPDSDSEAIISELWSTNEPRRDIEPLRKGHRMSASLEVLKKLCIIMQSELIFEVQIERRNNPEYYLKDEDRYEYARPHSEVFIFSADGKLRTAGASYSLG